MWIRSELKQKGKAAFKNNYWKCVVMSLITTVLFGGAASTSGANESAEAVTVELKNLAEQTGISIGTLLGILVSIVGVALVIYVLWNAFVLDLSFIGWHLLAGITCGLLGIFYVYPYVQATDAELYLAIKKEF